MVEKKRLGISTVLISVLLIVIALVFVGLLYTFGRGLFGGLSATASLEVVKYDIIVATDGSALILVEVKNVGNIKINSLADPVITGLTVTWNGWQGVPLDPGKTAFNTASINAPSGIEVGRSYPLLITGEAVDGRKVSISSSTVAHP